MVVDEVNNVDGLDTASAVIVSPDNQNVYVAGIDDNAVAVFSRTVTGTLTFIELKKNGQGGIFKDILIEIRDSILFELVWNILMFIPRMMIRLIKNIF